MKRYETIFILRTDLGESAQKDQLRRFQGIVASAGGDLIESDEWGFRELAYRIRGERRGFYVRLDYGGSGATMNEVERNLRLTDSVLRYLSVLVDQDVDPAAVRAEIEAHRRRTAEARAAAEAARAAAEAARAERAQAERAQAEGAAQAASESESVEEAQTAADQPVAEEAGTEASEKGGDQG
ncbi:MAG TPA: 30S ribosomal protein S6 [Candidatus Binataceae bacterium]|nr:30S ribosomal protein S6 [Candidatus Binataceae bacterium]